MTGKDPGYRLGDGKQFLYRQERVEQLGLMRYGPEAATHVKLKAPSKLAINDSGGGDRTHVMQHDQTTGVGLTPREGDLEFPPEVLDVRVPEQKARTGSGIGGHVEDLIATHTGQWAGGDVPNRIATSLTSSDTHRGQAPHQIWCVVDVDKVKLEVLPGRDVEDAVGVFLTEIRQHLHLVRGHTSKWNLDALHSRCVPKSLGTLRCVSTWIRQMLYLNAIVAFAIVVALPVDAPPEASLGKDLLVQPTLSSQIHLHFENIDFPSKGGIGLFR